MIDFVLASVFFVALVGIYSIYLDLKVKSKKRKGD
jgi:hypothetical protein